MDVRDRLPQCGEHLIAKTEDAAAVFVALRGEDGYGGADSGDAGDVEGSCAQDVFLSAAADLRDGADEMLPRDWATSVCSRTPRSRVIWPMSASGWMVPISLLACITETSTVSGVMAAAMSAGLVIPSASAGMMVIRKP